MQPRFITFEGGEGAGKSTQVKLLARSFERAGIPCITTREPGGSKGGEAIRALVVSGDVDKWSAQTEALLFMTARYDHVEQLIKPALANGTWVICDRFYDSTYVYQGIAKGVDTQWLDALYEKLFASFAPDATLLLDIDPTSGLSRATARGNVAESRFEQMDIAFHETLRKAFNDRAAKEPKRFITLAAQHEASTVHKEVISALNARFNLALQSTAH